MVFWWIVCDGLVSEVIYVELVEWMSWFVNALRGFGVGAGEWVFMLLGCVLVFYVIVLGMLKNRSVLCLLFVVFGLEFIC